MNVNITTTQLNDLRIIRTQLMEVEEAISKETDRMTLQALESDRNDLIEELAGLIQELDI